MIGSRLPIALVHADDDDCCDDRQWLCNRCTSGSNISRSLMSALGNKLNVSDIYKLLKLR